MSIADDERVVAIEPINEGQNDATLEGQTEEGTEESAPIGDSPPPPASGTETSGSDDGGEQGA